MELDRTLLGGVVLCGRGPRMRSGQVPVSRSRVRRIRLLDAVGTLAASVSLASAAALAYTDIAARSGLGQAVTFGSPTRSGYILKTTGTGAAIFDFDRDGDNDVFTVNGTTFPLHESSQSPPSFLYVNDGIGRLNSASPPSAGARAPVSVTLTTTGGRTWLSPILAPTSCTAIGRGSSRMSAPV